MKLCLATTLVLAGCGASYSADDNTANTIADREESRVLALCATDDAGSCTPSRVRAFLTIAYCANARELSAHGAPVPEAGVSCLSK